MTGCGQGHAVLHGYRTRVEISTVNRKSLDVSLQIPRAYGALESRILEEIRKKISRGRVHVSIQVNASNSQLQQIHIDEVLARRYVTRLRKVAKSLNLEDTLDASMLLRIPGVVTQDPVPEDLDQVWGAIRKSLRVALGDLVKMRLREGEYLRDQLESHLEKFRQIHARLKRYAPTASDAYRKVLLARLRTAGIPVAKQDERVLKEIALFAERSDILEEVTRLESHFKQAENALQSRDPIGRVMDFLSQEILRETNTIGSKAQDIRITRQVIQLKSVVEQFREQVQNIE